MARAPTVSQQIAEAAQQLAGSLQAGEFAGLDLATREGLHGLSRTMSGWADRLETAETEHLEALLACWRSNRGLPPQMTPRNPAEA